MTAPPTTCTRLPPAVTTKTYTATVTRGGGRDDKDDPKGPHPRDAEPELTNAQRLQRGLPLRAPNFKKRTFGGGGGGHPGGPGGGGGGPRPNPSCTPTTKTITATVSKTDRPCPTTTVIDKYCKTTTKTVQTIVPTTTFGTKTTTVPGTITVTSTKPPLTTSTVKTTTTVTVTRKPCKRDANGNIIEE